jgi:hypothetical protein
MGMVEDVIMTGRFIRAILLAGVFLLVLPGFPARAQTLTWWVELATRKVMQDRAPQPKKEIVLEAARNEYEPFQVVIRADGGDLMNVHAWMSELVGPKGAVISWSDIELYRAYYLTVTNPSGESDEGDGVEGDPRETGEYVDPLIPFYDPYDPRRYAVGTPFDVPENRLQPIFGDIYIHSDVPAGEYKGSLWITVGFVVAAEVPVRLYVWDFTLPKKRRIDTSYRLRYDYVLRFHGGSDGDYDEDALRICENYEEVLHKFRIDRNEVFWGPPDLPSPFFEFDAQGDLIPPDYTAYDAHIAPRLDGSKFDDGVPSSVTNVKLFAPGRDSGLEEDLTDEQYILAARDLARHLKEKGWFERMFVYVRDEPGLYPGALEAVAYDVALMKMADPDWETRMMATNHWVPELQYSIGIWCPLTSNYDQWNWSVPEYKREDYQRLIAQGDKLWFYVCSATIPPYAGYDIDTQLGHEPRILKWGAWYEGASGFLYWCTCCWSGSDPWNDLLTAGPGIRNGNGFLFYPGDHDGTASPGVPPPEGIAIDGPVISHRLMMIREGMEDWDYLLLAEDMGGKYFAKDVVEEVYTQFGMNKDDYDPENPPWTFDETELYGARHQLGEWISAGGYGKPGHDGDDDDDGFWGCSVSSSRPGSGAVSLAIMLILAAAIPFVWRLWRVFSASACKVGTGWPARVSQARHFSKTSEPWRTGRGKE